MFSLFLLLLLLLTTPRSLLPTLREFSSSTACDLAVEGLQRKLANGVRLSRFLVINRLSLIKSEELQSWESLNIERPANTLISCHIYGSY